MISLSLRSKVGKSGRWTCGDSRGSTLDVWKTKRTSGLATCLRFSRAVRRAQAALEHWTAKMHRRESLNLSVTLIGGHREGLGRLPFRA
jgi:hypothetical protein